MNDRGVRYRIAVSAVMLTAAMFGLGFRLAYLHLGAAEESRASFRRNRQVERTILGGRGNIYDRRGGSNVLAMNLAVKDVCADPMVLHRDGAVDRAVDLLSGTLGLPRPELRRRLGDPNRQFAYIRRAAMPDQAAPLVSRAPRGVFLQDATVRFYPHASFLCHVLGFVNAEDTGCGGVEQALDPYLRGCPGFREVRVDALRRELYWDGGRHVPAVRGAHAVVTIDQNVQYIVEKELDRIMSADAPPRAAWAVVQRVKTGEILAMVSRPAYDLNNFGRADADALLNRAIGCVYEPGSTLKAAVFAAALEQGAVTPDTVIDCERGRWRYRGRLLRDCTDAGPLTVAEGLKRSSNVLAAKVGLRLGERGLYECLRSFGLGRRMGFDLPGEESGILRPVSQWSGICASRVAIGQGVAVTSLQMLGVLAAIANDGYLMRPYVLSRVIGPTGQVLFETRPEVLSRPVSPATARVMRALLTRVTEEGGTGRAARVPGYSVAGKTGTAQKPVDGVYPDGLFVASFAGFLPADRPEIAIIVVVDEPAGNPHTGGAVAGPVFSRIAAQAVRCLEVAPVEEPLLARR